MAGPRSPRPPSPAEAEAFNLWVGGELTGPQIARAVGVPTWKVYQWRHSRSWPTRPKAPASNQLRVATKLWREDVPAKMIALVCDVSRATLSVWRVKYQWRKRQPGFRIGWQNPEAAERRARYNLAIDNLRREREARRLVESRRVLDQMEERRRQKRQEMLWRCDCGRLCRGDNCPSCGSLHPLLRAA